jgi:hypothetical protein
MADTISNRITKQLLEMRGFTAHIFGHRVKVYTDEAGWVAVETFILDSIFGAAAMNAIIDGYALLIRDYLANGGTYREERIEAFEASHPTVVDAFYQREVAKDVFNGGSHPAGRRYVAKEL